MRIDYGYKIARFWHPMFGFLKVEACGSDVLFPAMACARKLGFMWVRRALVLSETVLMRPEIHNEITRRTRVDEIRLCRLINYARRGFRSTMFDNWVYKEILPVMAGRKKPNITTRIKKRCE